MDIHRNHYWVMTNSLTLIQWESTVGKIRYSTTSGTKQIVVQMLLLTFKCLHGLTPSYHIDLIVKQPSLGYRSDNQFELVVPRTHLVTYGDRAFSAAVANIWNSILVAIMLCNTVTTFKICIKTYLFNLAYPIDKCFYQT